MQVISEKIGAQTAPMAIEDSKIGALGPIAFMFRFADIQNDGYSIFVIISNESLVSISGISLDDSIGLIHNPSFLKLLAWTWFVKSSRMFLFAFHF
jgi:hypothetical protein